MYIVPFQAKTSRARTSRWRWPPVESPQGHSGVAEVADAEEAVGASIVVVAAAVDEAVTAEEGVAVDPQEVVLETGPAPTPHVATKTLHGGTRVTDARRPSPRALEVAWMTEVSEAGAVEDSVTVGVVVEEEASETGEAEVEEVVLETVVADEEVAVDSEIEEAAEVAGMRIKLSLVTLPCITCICFSCGLSPICRMDDRPPMRHRPY